MSIPTGILTNFPCSFTPITNVNLQLPKYFSRLTYAYLSSDTLQHSYFNFKVAYQCVFVCSRFSATINTQHSQEFVVLLFSEYCYHRIDICLCNSVMSWIFLWSLALQKYLDMNFLTLSFIFVLWFYWFSNDHYWCQRQMDMIIMNPFNRYTYTSAYIASSPGKQMKWEFLTFCNLSSNRVTECNLKMCFEVALVRGELAA